GDVRHLPGRGARRAARHRRRRPADGAARADPQVGAEAEQHAVRLYLPATLETLTELHSDGVIGIGDDVVVAEGDSEDQEYDALMTAAESAAALVAELEPGERRRVVVVAELDVVHLPARITLADVVAVHADP